jgi:hypothetical protein
MTSPNPNKYPPQSPEVNIVPGPDVVLPEFNKVPQPESVWAHQRHEVSGAVKAIEDAHTDYAALFEPVFMKKQVDKAIATGVMTRHATYADDVNYLVTNGWPGIPKIPASATSPGHPGKPAFNPWKDKEQALDDARAAAKTTITSVMMANDPKRVLQHVFDRSGRNYGFEEVSEANHDAAIPIADKTSYEALLRHNDLDDVITRTAHLNSGAKDKRTQDALTVLKDTGTAYGLANQKSVHASMNRRQAAQGEWMTTGRGDYIHDLATEITDEYWNRREAVTNNLTTISEGLDKASLTAKISDRHAQAVTRALETVAGQLDTLSPYDPDRLHLVHLHKGLTYRLKQREGLKALDNGTDMDIAYTPDGGMILNAADPTSRRVIYSNGDELLAKRDGSGHIYTVRCSGDSRPRPENFGMDIQQVASRQPDRLTMPNAQLAEWDTYRTPETAARAHAELQAYNTNLEAIEHAYEDQPALNVEIDRLTTGLWNTLGLGPLPGNAKDLQDGVDIAIGRLKKKDLKRSPHIQQAIEQRQKSLDSWRANEALINKSGMGFDEVRDRIGEGRYFQGILDPLMRPETPTQKTHKRRGMFALMGSVKVTAAQIEPSADILTDGSVVWKNIRAYDTRYSRNTPSETGFFRWFPDGSRRRIA